MKNIIAKVEELLTQRLGCKPTMDQIFCFLDGAGVLLIEELLTNTNEKNINKAS